MKTSLERMGVNTEGIRISRTEQTGVALITLDSSAENSIVVCPGANGTVDSDEILAALEALRRARELTERYDDLLLLTAAEIPDHLP